MIWLLREKKCKCQLLNCIWLFAIPWTVAHQAPLSMEFFRQEYWSMIINKYSLLARHKSFQTVNPQWPMKMNRLGSMALKWALHLPLPLWPLCHCLKLVTSLTFFLLQQPSMFILYSHQSILHTEARMIYLKIESGHVTTLVIKKLVWLPNYLQQRT